MSTNIDKRDLDHIENKCSGSTPASRAILASARRFSPAQKADAQMEAQFQADEWAKNCAAEVAESDSRRRRGVRRAW